MDVQALLYMYPDNGTSKISITTSLGGLRSSQVISGRSDANLTQSGLVEQRGAQLPGLQVGSGLASGSSQQGGAGWGT